jgi:membrane associated rhomboid family serine protease
VKRHLPHPFGSTLEAIVYPVAILVVMWAVHIGAQVMDWNIVRYGVQPRTLSGLKGLFFMPWIHSPQDFKHILNNSLPILMLSSTIIYFYRDIALKVLLMSWLFSGMGVWLIARNIHSFHIGMSGVIYALAAFVFVSGVLRKYLPLQAMALFVAFLYGGMIWGVFPTEERISWEGHLSGFIIGLLLALLYVKKGPQAPKFQYEIEKELGIEPPDLEGMYWEKVRQAEEQQKLREEAQRIARTSSSTEPVTIVYDYKVTKRPNDSDQ